MILSIPPHGSLSALIPILESVDKSSVVVFLDFDETIFSEGRPRGGQGTVSLLTYLVKHGIPWFVNTARSADGLHFVFQDARNAGLGTFFGTRSPRTTYYNHKGVRIGQCGNVFSAGFRKDSVIDFVLKNFTSGTRSCIFVDDYSWNMITVLMYFAKENKDVSFIGVVFTPKTTFEPETGHGEGMEKLQHLARMYRPSSQQMYPV